MQDSIDEAEFGVTPAGESVSLYTLTHRSGLQARITTFGSAMTQLMTFDRTGRAGDVLLGYDCLDGYLHGGGYLGALIGRYANRISGGRFCLNGVQHSIATNEGPHALHGGCVGFDRAVWSLTCARVTAEGPYLELHLRSEHGDQGFPGTLQVSAAYSLGPGQELRVDLTAVTDRTTVVNLTQHPYFNLRGHGNVLDHQLEIDADYITPVDSSLIPTGELRHVAGTAFDFRTATPIGERLLAGDEQLRIAGGYDHNWVLNAPAGVLARRASVYEPESGRVLELYSTQPGLQFYSGNHLGASYAGRHGWRYQPHDGFCLEPQCFPDSLNHPAFPDTRLESGVTWRSTIAYRFSTR